MKKIIAMLMVLSMILSCTAMAEPAGKATQTTAQLYINPQLMQGAPEQVLTLVDTINSLIFTTTEGENYTTVAYGANDATVCEYTVATTDEGGLLFFNSLYPNTAILLDFAKVAALIEKYLPISLEEVLMGAQSIAEEAAMVLAPFVEDVYDLIVQLEGEVQADEMGNMYLTVNTHHLATLLKAWISRLSNDAELYSNVKTAMEMLQVSPATFESRLVSLMNDINQMLNSEAMELGTLGMFVQDGVTTLEITLANALLLSIDVYDYEGMACVDVLAIASSYGTDDWQATYEGILDGSNYYDVMFGVNTASMDDYAYAQLYAVEGGQTVSATLEAVAENADTDEQVITTMLSLDMAQGEQTINLGGMAAETVLVDDQGMPSVDDKYVLDVMALPIDMLMNGLPQFAENIVVAMPEAVQLVIDALAQVEGLEFLEGITVIEEEEMTATESLDEIAEEVMPETTTEVISEENTAVTTVTTIIPDDEIAPHEAPKMDGMIEDM